ncbi:MAG: transcription-repair coupling factor, partial [Pseudomonadota bacterium]
MNIVSGVAKISREEAWRSDSSFPVYDAPEGADAMAIAEAAATRGGLIVYLARDAAQAAAMASALDFFAPDIARIDYPAWDCLPYDRASPSPAISSARMAALSFLLQRSDVDPEPNNNDALIVTTTAAAVIQRTPPVDVVRNAAFSARPGASVDMDGLVGYLSANGYSRASTVREAGEFAVRGGLIDIFPPGSPEPFRLDFFGDTLESVRAFDPEKQTTTRQMDRIDLGAATEVLLTDETITSFRKGFRERFGASTDDPVYEAVSAGRKYAGMEHWLPLFYGGSASLFDFVEDALIFREHLVDDAVKERFHSINDYFGAREDDLAVSSKAKGEFAAPAYRPLPPNGLYLAEDEFDNRLTTLSNRQLSPFSPAEGRRSFSYGSKVGRTFAAERSADGINVFEVAIEHIKELKEAGKRTFLACWSAGSADRMATVLKDHGVKKVAVFDDWRAAEQSDVDVCAVVLGLD